MNPILPLNEYIPDGEPHVFDDRVYLYGSHDEARGDRFCVRDYTVWSAPTDDLSRWTNHGVTYKKIQDPRSRVGREADYYAPDCVRGTDGRYYLYYCAMGPNVKSFGPMSVAVSDGPAGPFEHLGDIRYPDGSPVLKYLTNDPAVINDNGRIWLYYGWGLARDFRSKTLSPIYNLVQKILFSRSIKEIKETKPSILSCAVVELCDDMTTVKGEPKAILDSKTTAPKDSELYNHAFYEAPSIRKIGDTYYLVYSSGENNELAYATSKRPDGDFEYRGVIISNSDLGYEGNEKKKAPAGTIHGGIERINGRWYVFYHRCTNNTDFSRQACVEPIEILPDGSIPQVEITTQGAGEPIKAIGKLEAARCCNIITPKPIRLGLGRQQKKTRIDDDGKDVYVADVEDGVILGYKYLCFKGVKRINITCRGKGSTIEIVADEKKCGEIITKESGEWEAFEAKINIPDGTHALYLKFKSKGKRDILEIEFI